MGVPLTAEGRISVYTVLRDLANSLPWSDIDTAANCDSDKQWFAPRPRMFLVNSSSFA